MTKTKKQLRAEAVERLKEYHDWEAHQKSLANITLAIWPMSVDMSNDKRVDALIDLLTDDDANDDSTPEKVVSGSEQFLTPLSNPNETGNGDDSREKLEADMAEYLEREWYMLAPGLLEKMGGWLDRQAAITERECLVKSVDGADAILIAECAELQAQVDELQEKLRIGWEFECKLQAERDHYRSKFGKCLDYADAIHALMDDEGLA